MLRKDLLEFVRKYNKQFAITRYSKLNKPDLQSKIEEVLKKKLTGSGTMLREYNALKKKTAPKKAPNTAPANKKAAKEDEVRPVDKDVPKIKKKAQKTNIVVKVKDYGRGIDKSDVSGFRKLSHKEVFGSRAKKQPENIGNEYYLTEVTTQKDKDKLEQLSLGYPSEITFFKISRLDKKFGIMGEKNISHRDIRRGKLE